MQKENVEHAEELRPKLLFDQLLNLLPEQMTEELHPFEEFIETHLPELIDASAAAQVGSLRYSGSVCF